MERDLGVLVNKQLHVSEQCAVMAKEANGIFDMMDWMNKGIASRDKITIISLSHLTGHTCNTGFSVFSFGP